VDLALTSFVTRTDRVADLVDAGVDQPLAIAQIEELDRVAAASLRCSDVEGYERASAHIVDDARAVGVAKFSIDGLDDLNLAEFAGPVWHGRTPSGPTRS